MASGWERLLPQARYEAVGRKASAVGLEQRIRRTNRIIGKQCGGLGGKGPLGEDTLWKLLNGRSETSDEFREEGQRRLEYAREGMGVREFRALYENAALPLEHLARWRREGETGETPDPVNTWLNTMLREEEEAARKRRTEERIREVGRAAMHQLLTIVVGAGASKAKPANVPLYGELAGEWRATEEERKRPGEFFDRIKEEGGKLRRELAERVGAYTTPSRVHKLLVELHAEAGARNLITTNWDLLLEVAQREMGVEAEVWPVDRREPGDGRAATGIVHLHGSVERPEAMLVTEKEMEAHYGGEGVYDEVGFLTEVLGGRTVLYVGYSHGDKMIAEIQSRVGERERQLSPNSAIDTRVPTRRTWSLVRREGTEREWRKRLQSMRGLGIEPIVYRDHDELPELLETLVDQVKRDAAWDRERLQALGRDGASDDTNWEEVERLMKNGGPRLQHFLGAATPGEWKDERFVEAGAKEAFVDGNGSKAGSEVAKWLCQEIDESRIDAILWMMAKSGGRMGRILWDSLGSALSRNQGGIPVHTMETVATLMIEMAEKFESLHHTGWVIEGIARRCQKDNRLGPTVQGWKVLARAKLVAEVQYSGINDRRDIEVGELKPALALESWETHRFWKRAVEPTLESINREIWETGLQAMERYQILADRASKSGKGWNSWAFRRAHIPQHEQDRRNESAEGSIIESMCRAMDQIGRQEEKRGEWMRRVHRMARSEAASVRRLAVDAIERTIHWDSTRKLIWATRRMNDFEIEAELWKLCRSVLDTAGEEARMRFWTRVERGQGKARIDREGWLYRLLTYLEEGGSQDLNISKLKQGLQVKHPEWKASLRGVRESRIPSGWTSGEILDKWTKDKRQTIAWMVREWKKPIHESVGLSDFTALNEDGRRKEVQDAIAKEPEIGAMLAERLGNRGEWEHPGWRVVCQEAGKSLSEETARRLVETVVDTRLVEGKEGRHCGDLAQTLAKRANEEKWTGETRRRIQQVFIELLPDLVRHDGGPEGEDLINWTINTAAGKVVEAIILMTEPGHINTLQELARVANRDDTLARHLRLAMATHIRRLLHTSSDWTEENVVKRIETVSEYSEERREWWTGLEYAAWDQMIFTKMDKALIRELRFPEPRHRGRGGCSDDTAARIYAVGICRRILEGEKGYGGRELEGICRGRRESIVGEICGMYWREKDFQRKMGWEKVVNPMWGEILQNGGASKKEQAALLECFSFISKGQQEEFRERFVMGPPVEPGGMLENEEQQVNRAATLEVAIHCASAYSEHRGWVWDRILEKVSEWIECPMDATEVKLAERLFAMTGWR